MAINFKINPTVLKSVSLFASFSDQQITTLLTYVQHRSFARNVYVMHAGEETDSLYVMLSGKAKVVLTDDHGREVILGHMGPQVFSARWAYSMISRAQPVCIRWSLARCCACRNPAL